MSKSIYEVSSYDVCVSGFERLRSYSEFMLLTQINAESSAADLLQGLLSDIQSCMRPNDFDYAEADRVVCDYFDANIRPLFSKANPFGLDPVDENDSDYCDDSAVSLILYVRDVRDGAHYPVY